MTPRTTDEILENEPVDIPLAGKVYTFAEPGARTCRRQLAKGAEVGELVKPAIETLIEAIADLTPDELARMDTEQGAAEVMAARLPAALLVQLTEATEAMLDFLLEVVPAMADDREHIENMAADTNEIRAAFEMVTGVLVRPMKRTPSGIAALDGAPQDGAGIPATA